MALSNKDNGTKNEKPIPMRYFTIVWILIFLTPTFGNRASAKEQVKILEQRQNLKKIVEQYASYYRVRANVTGFTAKQTTRNAKTKKHKKIAKKKKPRVPIQKFQFHLNVVQEDIRQVKFGWLNLGGKIKHDVAQRYCNEQNLKMDYVVISLLSNEEHNNKRDIKFFVRGSCIKYQYRVAAAVPRLISKLKEIMIF